MNLVVDFETAATSDDEEFFMGRWRKIFKYIIELYIFYDLYAKLLNYLFLS